MSQINCIENILSFFKKRKDQKRKRHKQEETAHKDLLLSATKY